MRPHEVGESTERNRLSTPRRFEYEILLCESQEAFLPYKFPKCHSKLLMSRIHCRCSSQSLFQTHVHSLTLSDKREVSAKGTVHPGLFEFRFAKKSNKSRPEADQIAEAQRATRPHSIKQCTLIKYGVVPHGSLSSLYGQTL